MSEMELESLLEIQLTKYDDDPNEQPQKWVMEGIEEAEDEERDTLLKKENTKNPRLIQSVYDESNLMKEEEKCKDISNTDKKQR